MPQAQKVVPDVTADDLDFQKQVLVAEGFTVQVRSQPDGLFTLIGTGGPAGQPDQGVGGQDHSADELDPPPVGVDANPSVANIAIAAGLAREATAFLAAIADGEARAWNLLFGGGTFHSYDQFPDWPGVRVNGNMTHAAGRFQFQPGTWAHIAAKLGLTNYGKRAQVLGAWENGQEVYRRKTGAELRDALIAGDLDGVQSELQSEWTGGADDGFPDRYRQHLALL